MLGKEHHLQTLSSDGCHLNPKTGMSILEKQGGVDVNYVKLRLETSRLLIQLLLVLLLHKIASSNRKNSS